MSIIRIDHNKEHPFVSLNKESLWDKNLSLKATGLWARCMSRPTDWVFCVDELAKNCKEGKRAIYSAIKELINAGFAIRIDISERGTNGKFCKKVTEYVFIEFKLSPEEIKDYVEKFKKFHRECYYGDVGDGDLRNAPLLIKNKTKKDITKNPPQGSKKKAVASAPLDVAGAPVSPSLALGSEEEVLHQELKEKGLTRKECDTILAKYSVGEVRAGVKLAEGIKPKVSYRALLFDILREPKAYQRQDPQSNRLRKVEVYQQELRRTGRELIADYNEGIVPEGKLLVLEPYGKSFATQQLSLASDVFDNDIDAAIKILQNLPTSMQNTDSDDKNYGTKGRRHDE